MKNYEKLVLGENCNYLAPLKVTKSNFTFAGDFQ